MGAGLLLLPGRSYPADELDRMIGRMVFLNMYWQTPPGFFLRQMETFHIGGAYLDRNPLVSRQAATKAVARLNEASPEPMLLVTDCEGDKVNKLSRIEAFESARSLGRIFSEGFEGEKSFRSRVAAKAGLLAGLGLNMNFDPVLDLAVPGSAIGSRSYGSDPELVARMARVIADTYREAGVHATAKHFPGLGSVKSDTHHVLPRLDKSVDELLAADLVPFRAAIESGISAVMAAHVRVTALDEDRPASLSPAVIGGLLREELGFKGLVITDSLTMGAITRFYSDKGVTGDRALGSRCVDAIKAGADAVFNFHTHPGKTPVLVAAVREAVKRGDVPLSRIEESNARINALLGGS